MLGPDRKTDATDILRNQLEAIGHGNTSVLYQLFKEPRFQPLHWGGMITTDSRKTPQFESAKSIGELVSKHKDFLLESTVAPAKVAIYIAKENHVIMHGLNHEPFFLEELRGVYRYYWSKNHTIDFITDSHFEKGLVSRYEVIHFPLVATIKPAMTKHLEKYVENGGHAVMSARFGYMDAHGWYQHRMPGNNLHSVFGFEVTACEKEEAPTIVLKNGERVPGYHHKETLALSDHCETLATFEDGTPAVMESGLKKGTVLYFATHPGQAHLKEGHSLMDSIMTPYLEKCGVSPSVTIAGHEDWATRIDPHVLLRDHEKWLILTHYVPKESKPLMHEKTTITVTLDEPVIELRNVLLNTAHPFKVRGGKTHFDVVVNDETFPVLAYRTAGSDRNA
ncbi:MAG: beta-galactosidase trimerization domain-containing protein [Candidatus Izemoplasmataceae bacterium]